jgi:hypothetical protein
MADAHAAFAPPDGGRRATAVKADGLSCRFGNTELRTTLAVGRRLRAREARQACVIDAAEFAIDVRGFCLHVAERRNDARI